jgi:hypothetical protein
MGYLICQRCGGYYKLREGESADDFVSCECYGPLKYVENLEDYSESRKKLASGSFSSDDSIDVSEQTSSDELPLDDVKSSDEVASSGEPTVSYDKIELDKKDKSDDDLDSVNDFVISENVESDEEYDADKSSVLKQDVDLEEEHDSIEDSEPGENIPLNDRSESESFSESESYFSDDLEQNKTKSKVSIYSNYLNKEPAIQNRAYYRQSFYGDTKPDISKYKLFKDVDSLIKSLTYPDPQIKQEAVQALGVIGDPKALKSLEDFIKEENSTLKIYAEIAVNQIKSKKYGFESKNRNYYRNIYSSQKNKTPDLDMKEENKFNAENKVVSKNIISNIPDPNDVTPKKVPEISIKSTAKAADKTNNNLVSTESSEPIIEPQIISKDIKSSQPREEPDKVIFSEDKSSEKDFEVSEISDDGSLGTISKDDDNSEDKLGSEVNSHIDSEEKSLKNNFVHDKLSESNYLGLNIQNEVISDKFVVDEPSKVYKSSNITEDKLEDNKSKEILQESSFDNLASDKTKTTLNRQLPSTQSKLGVYPDDKLVSTDNGTSLKISKNLDVKESNAKTMPTKPSVGTETIKNPTAKIKSTNKDEVEDIYFIKWLGIKNSDKSLIGFIFLFALALIIGVVLTTSSK